MDENDILLYNEAQREVQHLNDAEKYVREQLFAMQDLGYRDFHAKLVPNLSKEKIKKDWQAEPQNF